MRLMKRAILIMAVSLLVTGFIGCKEKGPAEKAGEKIDETMKDASEKANELMGK